MRHLKAGSRIGRHAVLVSGHSPPDYPPVDFEQAAINLWTRIKFAEPHSASRHRAILFNFSSGEISQIAAGQDERVERHVLESFTAPMPQHYGKQDHNRRLFVSPQTRTLSILDVYAYIFHLGTHSPGSVESLLFVAHAWEEGPILINTVDPFPQWPWHSPADKDARRKDLITPQLSQTDRMALRKAFSPDGYCINAGCGGQKALQPLLLRAAQGESWSSTVIKTLQTCAWQSWNQTFANAANVPCFGAFPGIATGLELDSEKPTLSVPQQAIADRPDFSAALQQIQRTLHFSQDPWGLGLMRFNPYPEAHSR